ncbi:MAG: hypothetical protein PW735_09760 [Acidobacteriaceae bacterium]|nr:hypothetical protein [Acidobacteriaceae bacterium]
MAYSSLTMRTPRHLGRSLVLTGLILGLCALGVLRHHEQAHPAAQLASSHHSLPVHAPSRRSSQGRSGAHSTTVVDHFDRVHAHAHSRGSDDPGYDLAEPIVVPAILFDEDAAPVFRRRNILAYRGAARAPGRVRGPPQLS